MTDKKLPTPGEQAHWLVTGRTFATGESAGTRGAISQRGATFTVTTALIEANANRFNESWVNDLHNPDAQISRWGQVVFAPGPAPSDMEPWTAGTVEEAFAREDARRVAQGIPDALERQKAMKALTVTFGRARSSQVSISLDGGLPGLNGGTR